MYNQLILIFIIFILIFFFLNKYEHFSSEDKIVGNKDIFLPSYDLQNLQNIKINKICIKDSNGEIECLTKEQLFNAMELPIFRKQLFVLMMLVLVKIIY